MPRRLLGVLVVSVLVLLAVAVKPILLPAGNPRLTQENFERIKEGMQMKEVEAILGPPGDYRTGPTLPIYLRNSLDLFGRVGLIWKGGEGEIRLWVDSRGIVSPSEFLPTSPEPVGLLDLLRWRWDRWRESRR
jgi:hypothetical protein